MGHVREQCRFLDAPANTADIAMQSGGNVSVPFRLYCNTGFTVKLSSEQGAMVSDTGGLTDAGRAAGFSDRVGYTARFEVQRDDGTTLAESCTSHELHDGAAGCAMSSSHGLHSSVSAMNQSGRLAVNLPDVNPEQMVAGGYSDVLTVNVQAQL